MSRLAFRRAIGPWLEARLYVLTAFVVTDGILDRLEPPPAFTPLQDGLLAWDGTWYRQIADHGYVDALDPAARFFPLFPLLGRWVGALVGDTEWGLILVANLASLVAAAALYALTVDETGDDVVARRAVRLLALFPPAFVLVLAYSEGLFLALGIGFVLAARRRRWVLVAGLGFLAGLTRPVAGLLALPALVGVRETGDWRRPSALVAACSAPLGSLTFLVWAERALGDGTAPLDRQRELRGGLAEPFSRLVRALVDGIQGDQGEAFHFLAAVVIIALTVVAVWRLRLDLSLYAAANAVVLLAADNLNSMERYALSAFPLVIAAALASRDPRLDRWLPTASAVGMVAVTTLALNGVYVP